MRRVFSRHAGGAAPRLRAALPEVAQAIQEAGTATGCRGGRRAGHGDALGAASAQLAHRAGTGPRVCAARRSTSRVGCPVGGEVAQGIVLLAPLAPASPPDSCRLDAQAAIAEL